MKSSEFSSTLRIGVESSFLVMKKVRCVTFLPDNTY